MSPTLRPARPDDAAALSALAYRATAFWGYSPAYLAGSRAELEITPAALSRAESAVMECEGQIGGFSLLELDGASGRLRFLLADPDCLGQGIERQLWRELLERARALRLEQLQIVSDPYAESFFVSLGAQRTGLVPSASIPGRHLPQLSYRL
ncbi:GNAT family N-acetyltransferase [Deinococcus sonorensis]|uniref:GNAT family N-acetyltransferase n=2 Tax=Deinococcus sonorensis TaxID=309891 RepID=A0AAU7UAD5_9DEIO